MVVRHPYVVVEVACGTQPNRRAIITLLGELESTPVATPGEVLEMTERTKPGRSRLWVRRHEPACRNTAQRASLDLDDGQTT